jgi:hypothetical protein
MTTIATTCGRKTTVRKKDSPRTRARCRIDASTRPMPSGSSAKKTMSTRACPKAARSRSSVSTSP